MDLSPFALFVSPVEGHLVSRFGTARQDHGPSIIGGTLEKLHDKPAGKPLSLAERGAGRWSVNPDQIEAITKAEVAQFGREYRRAIKGGALVERSAEEFAAQLAADAKRATAANKKAEEETRAAKTHDKPAASSKRSRKE